MTDTKRIAVIGAGAAGLVAAKTLAAARHLVTVFERNANLGGVWQTKNTDSPLYDNLTTNLPAEVMAYRDFPYYSRPGYSKEKRTTAFVTAQEVLNYLDDYAAKHNLSRLIKYNHEVVRVRPLEKSDAPPAWEVATRDLATGEQVAAEQFDGVLVCNGHYNTRSIPRDLIAQVDAWRGETMHSKEYSSPMRFAGKRVAVVGARASGSDLAHEISAVASHVYICDRTCPANEQDERVQSFKLAKELENGSWNVGLHPQRNLNWCPAAIELIAGTKSVRTSDGVLVDIDCVVWATGYSYDFPFLDTDITNVVGGSCVRPLYRHMIHPVHTTLHFLGLPFGVVPFPMMEIQSILSANLFSGRAELPPLNDRIIHDNQLSLAIQQGSSVKDEHYMSVEQWDYCRQLLVLAKEFDDDWDATIKWRQQLYNTVSVLRRGAYPGEGKLIIGAQAVTSAL